MPAGGTGAKAVLEVRSHKVPFILEEGQIVRRSIYERMSEVPEILYGRDLGSNYQAQGLKLSKHFKQPAGGAGAAPAFEASAIVCRAQAPLLARALSGEGCPPMGPPRPAARCLRRRRACRRHARARSGAVPSPKYWGRELRMPAPPPSWPMHMRALIEALSCAIVTAYAGAGTRAQGMQ